VLIGRLGERMLDWRWGGFAWVRAWWWKGWLVGWGFDAGLGVWMEGWMEGRYLGVWVCRYLNQVVIVCRRRGYRS